MVSVETIMFDIIYSATFIFTKVLIIVVDYANGRPAKVGFRNLGFCLGLGLALALGLGLVLYLVIGLLLG
jgi:hypothetical protein